MIIKVFRLNEEPTNTSTVGSCLMDEMEDLRDFHGKNGSLAFKHRERSLVYLDIVYCLM